MSKKHTIYFIIFFAAAFVLTFLDQLTKFFVARLKDTNGIPLIKDVFELYYIENTGTAWGLFAGYRVVFLILTIVVFSIILYFVFIMPKTIRFIPFFIMLILLASGAIGNFMDRLLLGYVRDFLYFKLIDFPVFNLADCYVTVAAFLMVILILFIYKDEELKFIPLFKGKKNE